VTYISIEDNFLHDLRYRLDDARLQRIVSVKLKHYSCHFICKRGHSDVSTTVSGVLSKTHQNMVILQYVDLICFILKDPNIHLEIVLFMFAKENITIAHLDYYLNRPHKY